MFISGITYNSLVDGEGIRNVLYISGCKHYCKGCHNPQTWSFTYGSEFSKEVQLEFIKKCSSDPLLDGITISGGDPMYSADELTSFLKLYKEHCPNHTIWIYSGFTYDEIKANPHMNEVLKYCSVLVDGLFVQELKDLNLKFRGSSNQNIIYLGVE